MIFHENRLLADDSHVISDLIFVENWRKCRKICRLLIITFSNNIPVKTLLTLQLYDTILEGSIPRQV